MTGLSRSVATNGMIFLNQRKDARCKDHANGHLPGQMQF